MLNTCFISFKSQLSPSLIPNELNNPFDTLMPEICKLAAIDLQEILLKNQHKWEHNFGLEAGKTGPIKGKMFGVLVVETVDKELGYLCTFSGKLKDEPHPKLFVPSLFDISTNDYFINKGMAHLTAMGEQIKRLKSQNIPVSLTEVEQFKKERQIKSVQLQQELFDHYHFLNKAGETKSLCAIFEDYSRKKPAAGSGECAAPKLLHYAYTHKMKPLAIAEFWWGQSNKAKDRIHGNFYPACESKCRPILSYMLG